MDKTCFDSCQKMIGFADLDIFCSIPLETDEVIY